MLDLKLFLMLGLGIVQIHGFPGGAPSSTCGNLQPSPSVHGSPQPQSSLPYKLEVKEPFVDGGKTIRLELVKLDDSSDDFMGFLVQGRLAGTDDIVGSFVVSDNE